MCVLQTRFRDIFDIMAAIIYSENISKYFYLNDKKSVYCFTSEQLCDAPSNWRGQTQALPSRLDDDNRSTLLDVI